ANGNYSIRTSVSFYPTYLQDNYFRYFDVNDLSPETDWSTYTKSTYNFAFYPTHVDSSELRVESPPITISNALGVAIVYLSYFDALGGYSAPEGSRIEVPAGETFHGVVATFRNSANGQVPEDYPALIDWGDGTITRGDVSLANGLFSVQGTHAFAVDGVYPVN